MSVRFEVLPAQAGLTLGAFLRRRGVSLSVLRSAKYLPDGLLLNGAQSRTNALVATGDAVVLNLPEETDFSAMPQALPLQILYASSDALVLNKPAGMLTHPVPGRQRDTLANAVCGAMQRSGQGGIFRPVGRLDADTSGLVLCAKSAVAAPLLAKTLKKAYMALAEGVLPLGQGVVDAPLGPQTGSKVRQAVCTGGRPACTRYQVVAAGPKASLLLVRPITGRTHQIRAHFAHLGHPLLGDGLYGGGTTLLKRHALHCAVLCFEEFSGNQPRLYCPPPNDLKWALYFSLGREYYLEAADFNSLFTDG